MRNFLRENGISDGMCTMLELMLSHQCDHWSKQLRKIGAKFQLQVQKIKCITRTSYFTQPSSVPLSYYMN
jgi:hypothetical protein